ncbi:MAG: chemotaxis protein CheX [Treponema sp.]|jgi:chemotaxis protein CheX|nr:chemotaxis protein CheX [Treponema sp.]
MEKYIQPFVDVCINVFKELIRCDIIAGRPFFIHKHDALHQDTPADWDISGVIGLTGEAQGAVVLSMKKDLALKLTDMLTGSEHTDMDDDVIDAIGELINIIAGNVKREFESTFRLVISLPTIITGKGHTIQWSGDLARILCIPFNLHEGNVFCLLVALAAATPPVSIG